MNDIYYVPKGYEKPFLDESIFSLDFHFEDRSVHYKLIYDNNHNLVVLFKDVATNRIFNDIIRFNTFIEQ